MRGGGQRVKGAFVLLSGPKLCPLKYWQIFLSHTHSVSACPSSKLHTPSPLPPGPSACTATLGPSRVSLLLSSAQHLPKPCAWRRSPPSRSGFKAFLTRAEERLCSFPSPLSIPGPRAGVLRDAPHAGGLHQPPKSPEPRPRALKAGLSPGLRWASPRPRAPGLREAAGAEAGAASA